jgi:hypothetical protein
MGGMTIDHFGTRCLSNPGSIACCCDGPYAGS